MAEAPEYDERKLLYIIAKTLQNIEKKMDYLNEKMASLNENLEDIQYSTGYIRDEFKEPGGINTTFENIRSDLSDIKDSLDQK